jgi:hypothetical protein
VGSSAAQCQWGNGMSISLKLRVAGPATLAGLYFLFSPFSSGGAWGQYLTGSEFVQSRTGLASKFQRGATTKHPDAFALQPTPARPAVPPALPVAIPAPDPNTALGGALASCDKSSENFETPALPGARGEVKPDRCYRGRDNLVCSFGALLTEARSLLESYKRIIDANYSDLSNLEGICRIRSGTLANHLESATEFSARFKALKAQYDARINCATSVQESFRDVTLSDMAQAPDLLESMIDTIERDMTRVSAIQAQVAGLADRIDASQKAMNTILKVHHAMCPKDQTMDAENRATR